jgi:hypothetical protein
MSLKERTSLLQQADLIEELRDRARKGERPCALAELIGQRVGVGSHVIYAVAYFKAAFGLTLLEARHISLAPIFEQGRRTAASVDAEMMAIMEKRRNRWDPIAAKCR